MAQSLSRHVTGSKQHTVDCSYIIAITGAAFDSATEVNEPCRRTVKMNYTCRLRLLIQQLLMLTLITMMTRLSNAAITGVKGNVARFKDKSAKIIKPN